MAASEDGSPSVQAIWECESVTLLFFAATDLVSPCSTTALSRTNSLTVFCDLSKTTQSWPSLIKRRTIFAPILAEPIMPSCNCSPLEN